MGTVSTLK